MNNLFIFSLVAVSIDRFWAIQWPLTYPYRMTSKVAQVDCKHNAFSLWIIFWVYTSQGLTVLYFKEPDLSGGCSIFLVNLKLFSTNNN